MSSRTKKDGASAVATTPEAQLTNDGGSLISMEPREEKYLKKHPLNVNATFNKRLSLL